LASRRGETNTSTTWACLVDGVVDIAPAAGDLGVGLIGLPAVANRVPAGPGGLGQQRREPQHPPVDGDVVDFDAAFGQQLLDVAVGEAKAEVPAHRSDDHVGWEAEAGEGTSRGQEQNADGGFS
jgi:hypothetical protein